MVRVDFLGFRHVYDEKLLGLALNDAQTLLIDNYVNVAMPYMALVISAYTQRYRDRDYTKHAAAQGVDVPVEEVSDLEDYLREQGVQAIPPSLSLVECTLCTDLADPDASARLQCGHTWHAGCIAELFEKTTVDESLFPPRCCEEIALADVQHALSPELRSAFSDKSIEFRTLHRVYCAKATCSKFLGAQTSQPAALRCQACSATTCSACKGSHPIEPGMTCEQSLDELKLAELAKANGWKHCPKCSRLVERSSGCNLMTCVCKHQFCYQCGVYYPPGGRTCKCPFHHLP